MRFGVDRSSARGPVQLAFGGGIGDGRIDAREIRGPGSRKSLGNAPRPCRVARPALRRRDDSASHEPGSADKFLGESARNAEAHHRAGATRKLALERGGKRRRVSATRDRVHAGPRGDARFLDEPRDRDDPTRVVGPDAHMP